MGFKVENNKKKYGYWEMHNLKNYDIYQKATCDNVYIGFCTKGKSKTSEQKPLNSFNSSHKNADMVLYQEILDAWLYYSQHTVKESTFARYANLINCHILNELGKYPVNIISTPLLEQYVSELLNNGRVDEKGGLSPKTVKDILTVIKSSIEYARKRGYPIICSPQTISVKSQGNRIKVLSQKEHNQLTQWLLEDIDLCKMGVLLSLFTGIRIGELCALRWENICLKDRVIKISETIQRVQNVNPNDTKRTKIIITEPKSICSTRNIPLPACIHELLQRFESNPKAFVLTGEVDKYIEPRTMQNRFKRYLKEANIPEINYHSLRHTFATRCVSLDFEIKSLSEILGHANVNITLNRYVHSSFELKKSNMNKLTLEV
jgi:integrase